MIIYCCRNVVSSTKMRTVVINLPARYSDIELRLDLKELPKRIRYQIQLVNISNCFQCIQTTD